MSHTVNAELLSSDTAIALSQNSAVASLDRISKIDVTAVITDATPSDKTFDTGTMEVQTFTFPAKAASTAGDYIAFYDTNGNQWAISLNKSGSDPAPTGAIYTAIPSGRKVHVDISADTTAAQVAARVETAVDALTGFTALIVTDDSAADGTMTFTQTVPGNVANAVPKSADDAGAGSITAANTTQGVATEVNPTANTVTVPSHGYTTGLKVTALTTTGTLPAGLSTGTVYYIIVVDSDTIKFATSQANALAGTAVDITGYGTSTAVHTIDVAATVAGTAKLQKTNDTPGMVDLGTATWVDLDDTEVDNGNNSYTISAGATKNWAVWNVGFRALRVNYTMTSGAVTARTRLHGKGV